MAGCWSCVFLFTGKFIPDVILHVLTSPNSFLSFSITSVVYCKYLRFHAVCVVSLLGAGAEIKFTIPVGRIFTYELTRETFQNDFEPLSKLFGKSLNPTTPPFCYYRTRSTRNVNIYAPFFGLSGGSLYDDPITFKCNLQNFPDLPEWLHFTQRHPYDNGFLYGTPTAPGKNIIEVWHHHLHQHRHDASVQHRRLIAGVRISETQVWSFCLQPLFESKH